MILSVIRHGSTSWNEQGRIQGRRDVPLSARGRGEIGAWRVPIQLSKSAHWVSSPLSRALETARLLSGSEPEREDALIEMDWGEWEGFTLTELRARFGAEFARNEALGLDFQTPGGESPRDVLDRVQRWLSRVSLRSSSMVAVTHKGVIRALLAAACGWDMTSKPPIRLQSDALQRFAIQGEGRVSLLEYNVPLARPAIDAA